MEKLKQFLIALVLIVILDFVWLGIVMKDFNLEQLREIGRIENGAIKVNYAAAAVTYVFMALALPFFILPQLKQQESNLKGFLMGGLMGLIVFGVFDMTNLAILSRYPIAFAAVDIAWGVFVYGFVSLISAKLAFR